MAKTVAEEIEGVRLLAENAQSLAAEVKIAKSRLASGTDYDIQRLLGLLDMALPLYSTAFAQMGNLYVNLTNPQNDHPGGASDSSA